MSRPARPFKVIGTRVVKLDAVEKVTGTVRYLPDLEVPGMVWGKILRSPVPHARIRRIDTRKAEALPGVLGVVTGGNVEQHPFGYAKDHLALKREVVRCIRDEVAVSPQSQINPAALFGRCNSRRHRSIGEFHRASRFRRSPYGGLLHP